jgi:hypothetical protein
MNSGSRDGGGYNTTLATKIAGEDITNDVLKITQQCNMTVVNMTDNSTTVSAGPAILMGIYVNTILDANACLITDAAVTKLTLPASMAAGSQINCYGAIFATSLIVDPADAAASGQIVVFWRANDA